MPPNGFAERDRGQWPTARVAGVSGLVFAELYLAHRLLQLSGPAEDTPDAISAWAVEHRGALLVSGVLNVGALAAFLAFGAALTSLGARAGGRGTAAGVLASVVVFVVLGLISTAAETALVQMAPTGAVAAVAALDQLQARVPVVAAVSAFTGALAVAVLRTGVLDRWVGILGAVAAVVFAAAAAVSLVRASTAGDSSPVGPAVFLAWVLLLCALLLRRTRPVTTRAHRQP